MVKLHGSDFRIHLRDKGLNTDAEFEVGEFFKYVKEELDMVKNVMK